MQECCICKTNETSNTVKTPQGTVAVCHECLDQTKDDFVFVCLECGNVHRRNKAEAMKRWENAGPDNPIVQGLKKLRDEQVVIGVGGCVDCPDVETEEVIANA